MARATPGDRDGATKLPRDREGRDRGPLRGLEGRSGDAALLLAEGPGVADRGWEVAGERQTRAPQAEQIPSQWVRGHEALEGSAGKGAPRKGFDAGISQVINLTCPHGYQVVIFRDASIAVARAGVLAAHSVPPASARKTAVGGLTPLPRSTTPAGGA